MVRVFTAQDQLSFAELSGDFNPIHVDAIAARRLMFGRQVVHGIHAVLWAIDRFFADQNIDASQLIRIQKLSVEFQSPMLVGDAVELFITSRPNGATLKLTVAGNTSATIELTFETVDNTASNVAISDSLPEHSPCRDITPAQAKNITGQLPLHFNPPAAAALFPALSRTLVRSQFAALLATTRLVGMELPGLHSLYTGLDLTASDEIKDPLLIYTVEGRDKWIEMLLTLAVKSPGFAGKISATFRPAPTRQAGLAEFRQLVQPDEFRGQRVLVIGGSRGLGEVAVKALVAGGADVRFTYYKGSADAQQIVADIATSAGHAACFKFDVQTDAAKLPQLLNDWRPTLLCYFATPVISSTVSGRFQADRFHDFCRVYIDAFLATFNELADDLRGVLYPSSSAIDELPANMADYAAAKVAAENMCAFLAKTNPAVRFHTPRYSRLATDQTATVMAVDTGDTKAVVIESLRKVTGSVVTASAATPVAPAKSLATGPAFAVAATFTGEPIEASLKFWMSELGQPGPVEFAQYNQVFQALFEPAGLLARKNFANAILIRLEDWIEGEKVSLDAAAWKTRLTPLIAELITAAGAVTRPSPTIVLICPPSTKVAAIPGVAGVLDELTAQLLPALKTVPGVYAFDAESISANYRVADYYDPNADAVGKIPYTPKYFAALGTFLSRTALAVGRAPFKVIVLDCDNTLWAGVCGEGGVSAVTISPGFRAMQQFMVDQSAQGKVICLCSKNVEADVWDIFDNHPGMQLKRSHIVAHRINWSPKSDNLRELAKELNVGLDSFIFLDDNPVECAQVRSSCPQVLTLQAPAAAEKWPTFLQHVWAFDQPKVSDQDRKRVASYQQNAEREAVRKQSAGLDDFLARLELRVNINSVSPANMERAAQLTQRTNQFNFSTIRRNESELIALLHNPAYHCDTVDVKDRFGDYGLVGIVITRADAGALVVDTMLLSCRVLGRGVEHRMLASIGERAKSMGLSQVEIPLLRSEKNQPALDFMASAAVEYRHETTDGFVYHIPADIAETIKANVITTAPAESETKSTPGTAHATAVPYQRIVDELHDIDAIFAAIDPRPVAVDGSVSLRAVVAELLAITPEQLTADRALSGARLPGSLGRAILDAALRGRLGIESPACYSAKTFGELETAVNGASQGIVPLMKRSDDVRTPAPTAITNAAPIAAFPVDPSIACGVDTELVANLPATTDYSSHEFYTANFTPAEIAYCVKQVFPPEHFAARWAAKEAIKKCEPSLMNERMRNLEVISGPSGKPSFRHHSNGRSIDLPHAVSLTHTSHSAVAMVARSTAIASAPIAPAGLLTRVKRKVKRSLNSLLTRDTDASVMAIMHPTAVILPEGTIDNLSGNKKTIVIGEHSHLRGRLLTYPHGGSITIGSWCYIGIRSEIWAMSPMVIGDRVQIAHNVTILDSSSHSRNAAERHAHLRAIITTGHPSTWADLPGITTAPIVIEDDVWIGANVIVLQGVRIGARSIVNAGAVVTADIPPDTIYWSEATAKSIPNYA